MKINNNTIAIIGIIIVVIVAIIASILSINNEIAIGLVLGSTSIGGVVGYLAKSSTIEDESLMKVIEALENDTNSSDNDMKDINDI